MAKARADPVVRVFASADLVHSKGPRAPRRAASELDQGKGPRLSRICPPHLHDRLAWVIALGAVPHPAYEVPAAKGAFEASRAVEPTLRLYKLARPGEPKETMMMRHPITFARAPIALAASLALSTSLGCSNKEPTIPQGSMSVSPDACVGVVPSVTNPLLPVATNPADCERPGICVGQPAANWSAYDFQDRSCGYGYKYGMKDFGGKVTVLIHLAGWCAYCQNQTIKLEQMRMELARQGDDVNFLIVNAKNADNDTDRQALVDNCSFAVFQDHPDFRIWELNGGGKDDLYIYDPSGRLLEYLPHNAQTTDLSTQANYDGLRDKLATLARRFQTPEPGTTTGTGAGTSTTGSQTPSGTLDSGAGPDTTATSTGT